VTTNTGKVTITRKGAKRRRMLSLTLTPTINKEESPTINKEESLKSF